MCFLEVDIVQLPVSYFKKLKALNGQVKDLMSFKKKKKGYVCVILQQPVPDVMYPETAALTPRASLRSAARDERCKEEGMVLSPKEFKT